MDPFQTRHALQENTSSHRKRTGILVGAFHLMDAGLMAIYALLGVVPLYASLIFFPVGALVGACWYFASGSAANKGWRVEYLDAAAQGILCCMYLGLAILWPQVGFLVLMSLNNLVASTAIRLRKKLMRLLSMTAVAAVVVIMFYRGSLLSAPLASVGQTLVSSAWVAAILVRGLFVNLTALGVKRHLGIANERLTEALAKIEVLASHDALTGLLNRRSLEQLIRGMGPEDRSQNAVAIAILDIDHFKRVNDLFGHAAGDKVIQSFAQAVQAATRSSDRIGRWGGEEFLLLAVGPPGFDNFRQVAERLRAAIEDFNWRGLVPGLSVTMSVGITIWKRGEPADDAIARADALLYQAKGTGRNRVCIG